MLTMTVVAIWTFITAFPNSAWNFYLLNDIETGVTVLNLYYFFTVFCLLLSPLWRRLLYKLSWFRVFACCAMIHAPSVILMAFITRGNYLWLYTVGIFIQSFVGVGLNLCWSNFAFVNTPQTDQTYYLSFYTLLSSAGSFLGSSAGAWLVRLLPENGLCILGRNFDTAPVLLLLQGILYFGCVAFILINSNRLQPEQDH